MKTKSIKKDIAIIGMACRFPSSPSINQFWEHLINGDELIHFYSDEELMELGVRKSELTDQKFIRAKSIINDVDNFDYSFFGYTREEAAVMDPQIRIMHEMVWTALENAGCPVFEYFDKIGLYLSASDNHNWVAETLMNPNDKVNAFIASQLSNKNFISTLISYSLNLRGPSYYINTACSSSLAAIHLACRNLLLKECATAVAGGIRIDSGAQYGYYFEEGMVSSRDGHTRPFDINSSGTIAGQGGGVVVLKRLEDALNDKDHIYAVIKASAVNNDGNEKVGYTAPAVNGQVNCIKQAHQIAGAKPEDFGYIETHGTGTKLGDSIEIEALNKVFQNNTALRCAIGSIKSNIGHPDTAAGIAGFIKATLALYYRKIPPSINFSKPNPEINFESGPFYVNTELKEWLADNDKPRMAGVSSLGIGGTNVHVVLEEKPEDLSEQVSEEFQLIPFSAKTSSSLQHYLNEFKEYLKTQKPAISNLAWTLQTGRSHLPLRKYFVAKNLVELQDQLENTIAVNSSYSYSREVVFLFPGQGSQYFGMAKDLYQKEPVFRTVMDEGFEKLRQLTSENYKSILGYSLDDEVLAETINHTKYTQPLVFLIECALGRFLESKNIIPDYVLGHSLGEYAAAVLSDVITLEDGIKLVVNRTDLIAQLSGGSMLRIDAEETSIIPILPKNLSIAAVNTNSSCVVSGTTETIEEFAKQLESLSVKYANLTVSHAFHSEMMDPMLDQFKEKVDQVSFSAPKYKFISATFGHEISYNTLADAEYWVKHLRNTVYFSKALTSLFEQSEKKIFVEVGPGNVLSSICAQHEQMRNGHSAIPMIRHPKKRIDDLQFLLESMGKLWEAGINFKWDSFLQHQEKKKISLPTYRFDAHKFKVISDPLSKLNSTGKFNHLSRPDIADCFYLPAWKKSFQARSRFSDEKSRIFLIFREGEMISNEVLDILTERKHRCIEVYKDSVFRKEAHVFSMNPREQNQYLELFETIEKEHLQITDVIYNWTSAGENFFEVSYNTFNELLWVCKNYQRHLQSNPGRIGLVNEIGNRIIGNEFVDIPLKTNSILLKVFAQENPQIFSYNIDIQSDKIHKTDAVLIANELLENNKETEVAYRYGYRWIPFYDQQKIPKNVSGEKLITNRGLILFTGNLGAIGFALIEYLLKEHGSRIIIIDKSLKATENNISIQDDPQGVRRYYGDISDLESSKLTVEKITSDHGDITGIIHGTEDINHQVFKPIETMESSSSKIELHKKIQGTLNLYDIFQNTSLDFVWIKSSLSALLGGLTYGTFAVANKFVDAFIDSRSESLKNWICIDLDGYGEGGITPEEMIEVFESSLRFKSVSRLIVALRDITTSVVQKSEQATKSEIISETISRPNLNADFVAPEDALQIEICTLWQDFFGYESIGIDDDFFALGGDSLKVMTMLKRIDKIYKVEINLLDFYQISNVRNLSREIEMVLKVREMQREK
jgi:phthiocerol/phenolphthiocerol synthesis type-I polyketide synthase E